MIGILLVAWALAADATPGPDWSDARARTDAQVAVVAALVDAEMAEKALSVLAELRAQGADDRRFDVLQARALHATGMSAEARSLLEAHVRISGRDADAWCALGVVLADSGDVPGSLRALEKARRLAPKSPTVLNNLGYVRMINGEAEEAARLFSASLAEDPAQPRTRNNLGFALVRLERDTEALQAFRAAGAEADARYNLGVACLNRGDRGSALTHFHAALEAAPGHPAAINALDRLLKEASP